MDAAAARNPDVMEAKDDSPSDDPTLSVRLETDEAGSPEFVEGDDKRHYKVVFEIENAPPDAYAATFELDASSYCDSVRTLRPESDGKFRLATTTCGDYPVIVRLHRSKGEDRILKDSVFRGLKRARGRIMAAGPRIDEALSYIHEH
jgi:hypothetical protein